MSKSSEPFKLETLEHFINALPLIPAEKREALLAKYGRIVTVTPQIYLTDALGLMLAIPELQPVYGVTHILNASKAYPQSVAQKIPAGISICCLDMDDTSATPLLNYLPTVVNFMEAALLQPGGRVLVHCVAGISRSVSCILGYWMCKEHLSLKDGMARIQAVRPHANPNMGFRLQLQLWGRKCMMLEKGQIPVIDIADDENSSDDDDRKENDVDASRTTPSQPLPPAGVDPPTTQVQGPTVDAVDDELLQIAEEDDGNGDLQEVEEQEDSVQEEASPFA
jgi:protein-tyrosine phosphatase